MPQPRSWDLCIVLAQPESERLPSGRRHLQTPDIASAGENDETCDILDQVLLPSIKIVGLPLLEKDHMQGIENCFKSLEASKPLLQAGFEVSCAEAKRARMAKSCE